MSRGYPGFFAVLNRLTSRCNETYMDVICQENPRHKASRIDQAWGLNVNQRARLPDDDVQTDALISIHESPHSIFSFSDENQANEWPTKQNQAFAEDSAIDVILAGDIEKLRYRLYYA